VNFSKTYWNCRRVKLYLSAFVTKF